MQIRELLKTNEDFKIYFGIWRGKYFTGQFGKLKRDYIYEILDVCEVLLHTFCLKAIKYKIQQTKGTKSNKPGVYRIRQNACTHGWELTRA